MAFLIAIFCVGFLYVSLVWGAMYLVSIWHFKTGLLVGLLGAAASACHAISAYWNCVAFGHLDMNDPARLPGYPECSWKFTILDTWIAIASALSCIVLAILVALHARAIARKGFNP